MTRRPAGGCRRSMPAPRNREPPPPLPGQTDPTMRKFFKYCLTAAGVIVLLGAPAMAAPKKKIDAEAAKRMSVPAGKPEIFELEPRGIQRGSTVEIKLIGTNLTELTELKLHKSGLTGQLVRTNERTA